MFINIAKKGQRFGQLKLTRQERSHTRANQGNTLKLMTQITTLTNLRHTRNNAVMYYNHVH